MSTALCYAETVGGVHLTRDHRVTLCGSKVVDVPVTPRGVDPLTCHPCHVAACSPAERAEMGAPRTLAELLTPGAEPSSVAELLAAMDVAERDAFAVLAEHADGMPVAEYFERRNAINGGLYAVGLRGLA